MSDDCITASSALEGIWMKQLQLNLSGWTEENHENLSLVYVSALARYELVIFQTLIVCG